MRWGKIILIVQAIAFLIIGFAFLSQLFVLDDAQVSKLTIEITSGKQLGQAEDSVVVDIKKRYTVAAWLLPLIAIIELLILSRI